MSNWKNYRIPFGKYKGKLLCVVAKYDLLYLQKIYPEIEGTMLYFHLTSCLAENKTPVLDPEVQKAYLNV